MRHKSLLNLFWGLLIASLIFTGCSPKSGALKSIARTGKEKATLRSLAEQQGLNIGVSVGVKPILKDPAYAALLAHEIDHLNGTLYIDY